MGNGSSASSPPVAGPSVLLSINRLSHRLERALAVLGNETNAEETLRGIATELIEAVERSPEVALASIYLSQIAGPYSVRHCVETAIVTTLVARAMGKETEEMVSVIAAALTMNAGMMRLSVIFELKGYALSVEERSAVRRHPAAGVDLLRRAGITDEEWIACVMMHHEQEDGSGYPAGLRAAEIPVNARLIGVADRYCALVSARNYRRSLLPPTALQRLHTDCQAPVDEQLAAHVAAQVGPFPPGTLVRLLNGEIGVVSSRRDQDDCVQIHTLRDPAGQPFALPQQRSTRDPRQAIVTALHEDDARLRFSMHEVWGNIARL